MDFSKLKGLSRAIGPAIGATGLAAGAYYGANNMLFNVEAGHRGLKFNRLTGLSSTVYEEGTHFLVPWFEWPVLMDVKTRPRVTTSLSGSRDLQMVNISLRTLARPNVNDLPELYRRLGPEFDEVVLTSIVNEVLKSVVAQFNATQLLTQREMVSRTIRQQLTQRATDFHILLDDVAITELSFSPEYEKAVEKKQVAQQMAEKAKYTVLQAREECKSVVLRAQATEKEAELIGNAVKNNPGFVELRRIDTAKEVAKTISRANNKVILSAESLLLNVVDKSEAAANMSANTSK